jgi:hypothetical protein
MNNFIGGCLSHGNHVDTIWKSRNGNGKLIIMSKLTKISLPRTSLITTLTPSCVSGNDTLTEVEAGFGEILWELLCNFCQIKSIIIS